jgi:alkylated DNA repair dioxygenase AlkB
MPRTVPTLPRGFVHRPGFLSPAQEADLRARLRALDYGEVRMRGRVARRRVATFGHDYAYASRDLRPGPPLPAFLARLRARVAPLAGVDPGELTMAAVNLYPPGAGIGWHRDAPAFGIVVGVSFGGAARLRLREGGSGGDGHEVVLAAGDAYVLSGPARWEWQHHVPPVREERLAVTFRTVREG